MKGENVDFEILRVRPRGELHRVAARSAPLMAGSDPRGTVSQGQELRVTGEDPTGFWLKVEGVNGKPFDPAYIQKSLVVRPPAGDERQELEEWLRLKNNLLSNAKLRDPNSPESKQASEIRDYFEELVGWFRQSGNEEAGSRE